MREGDQWVEVKAVEGTPQGELALIQLALRDEAYRTAVRRVKAFRRNYPVDYRREDAAMLAGHAQMARGYYMKAHEWYVRQLDEFPAGDLQNESLQRELDIANAFLAGRNQVWEVCGVWSLEIVRLSATGEAIEILMQIAERAPGSELAEKALMRIGDYYFDEENYRRAAEAYDEYLVMFPGSAKVPFARSARAQLRAARAVYTTYRSAKYDSTPLIDAELRFRNYRADYPDRVRADGIEAILVEIANRRAEADYYVAELFERLDRPKAAAFYYNQAAKRYGQTLWTARAEAEAKRLGYAEPAPKGQPPAQP